MPQLYPFLLHSNSNPTHSTTSSKKPLFVFTYYTIIPITLIIPLIVHLVLYHKIKKNHFIHFSVFGATSFLIVLINPEIAYYSKPQNNLDFLARD